MKVGGGGGCSVREVIKLVCEAAGRPGVVAVENETRAGDPAFLCANVSLIEVTLGLQSTYFLESSVRSLF